MRNLFALMLVLPLYAQAQSTADTPADNEQPALNAAAREDLRTDAGSSKDAGTTIVGERESPIGLYITPWRNAFSQQNIDRPPRLMEVDMSPVDRVVFARQVEYHEALSNALAAKNPAPAPAASTPSP